MSTIKEKFILLKTILSEESKRKYIAVFSIIFTILLLFELFIFNFKWLNSMFDKPLTLPSPALTSMTLNGDTLSINEDSAFIEFKNINRKLKYLYLKPGNAADHNIANISISASDEANKYFVTAPQRTVMSSVKRSQYMHLHFSGKVETLRIEVKGMKGKSMNLSSIKVNVHVPFMFSWIRLIILSLTCMLLYILRPKSPFYAYVTDLRQPWQKKIALALLVFHILCLFGAIHWNSDIVQNYGKFDNQRQYYDLIENFKSGHLYIDDNASKELKNMDNPYDTGARYAEHVSFRWDAAYYNGKYYCYFGVAPAVLLYLPYNLITGKDLPNHIALFMFTAVTMTGIMLLLWEIIKKWFKKTPFVIYLLMSLLFPVVSEMSYIVHKPDFYSIPNVSALMFAILGLWLWLSAEKRTTVTADPPSTLRLALGSVCIATTALCRPQFLLTSVFGVMFFWDDAFKERTLFSKKSLNQTLAVCLPFAVIGLITMVYNFARFGSPFDFGANYNLTTNDLTHRGMVFGRNGLGIFTYMLQPLRINAIFPFIHDFGADNSYIGYTSSEWHMGGIFLLYPILLFGIYGVIKKKLFACDKRLYRLVYISVIMAFVIALLDTQMGGLLMRYSIDFIWLAMIASSVTIFALFENYSGTATFRTVTIFVVTLSVLTILLSFLSVYAHSEYSLSFGNPRLYYSTQHLFAFWL